MGSLEEMFGVSIIFGLVGCTILLWVLWYFEAKEYYRLYDKANEEAKP